MAKHKIPINLPDPNQKLLDRAYAAIETSRIRLREFRALMDAFDDRQKSFDQSLTPRKVPFGGI